MKFSEIWERLGKNLEQFEFGVCRPIKNQMLNKQQFVIG